MCDFRLFRIIVTGASIGSGKVLFDWMSHKIGVESVSYMSIILLIFMTGIVAGADELATIGIRYKLQGKDNFSEKKSRKKTKSS